MTAVAEVGPGPDDRSVLPADDQDLRWLTGVRPWLVLAVAAAAVVLGGLFGVGIGHRLVSGGYFDPHAESSVAARVLEERFDVGYPQLALLLSAPVDIARPEVAAEGTRLSAQLRQRPGVGFVESVWTDGNLDLRSTDGRRALVLVHLLGDDRAVAAENDALVAEFSGPRGPVTVAATGLQPMYRAAERIAQRDLIRVELITLPLVGLALLVVYRSVLAAMLPLLVGGISIAGSMLVLRGLSAIMPVSIFALNLTSAIGLALSISYSLFLLTRFREELASGATPVRAASRSVRTTGRTVAYSALTVMLCLLSTQLLPAYFFASLGLSAIGVVGVAALAAIFVLPAALVLLGERVNRLDLTRAFPAVIRKYLDGSEARWYRRAAWVMRRPVLVLATVTPVLVLLTVPFFTIRVSTPTERELPAGAEVRTAAQTLRHDFPSATKAIHIVVLPEPTADGVLARYASRLSLVHGVSRVDSRVGSFVKGIPVAPEGVFPRGTGTFLRINTLAEPPDASALELVRGLRRWESPGPTLVTGESATIVDAQRMLTGRLGWMALVLVLATFALVHRFTGSLVLPLKALVLNTLSMAASFGVMVLVFQDGHLIRLVGGDAGLGFIDHLSPMLLFAIVFGVSMDYEIFLVSGIREEYLRTGDNTEAVARGLARNGRLITAAALVLIIAVGALTVSDLMNIKIVGAIVAVAVLIDVLLVRTLLVPAVMRVAGRWNWWPAADRTPATVRRASRPGSGSA